MISRQNLVWVGASNDLVNNEIKNRGKTISTNRQSYPNPCNFSSLSNLVIRFISNKASRGGTGQGKMGAADETL